MKQAVQVKCPNCQNLLRVPPDLVEVSVKCKHCGYILQMKKKPAGAAPIAAPPRAAVPVAKPAAKAVPAAQGRNAVSPGLDDLPEYTPPSAETKKTPTAAAATHADIDSVAPTGYNPAYEKAGRRHSGRGSYKGPRGNGNTIKFIVLGAIVFLGAGILAAVIAKPEWFKGKPAESKEQASSGPEAHGGTDSPGFRHGGTLPQPIGQMGAFPRRILGIGLSEYMYANPIQAGVQEIEKESTRRDFYKVVDRLASMWKVPKEEVFVLADSPLANNKIDQAHPPLKMVITGAIDRFLASCRPQDRIVLIFAGHAIEKEGKAYLVPLEGELDDVASLIPLEEVYEKLAKCRAQEKLVIFDVCRFDPGRGVERPAFGEMTEALDKALHDSPEGVSVWTSCSAGQYSYEYDYAQVDMRGLKQFEMYGSVFLNIFVALDLRGNSKKTIAIAQPANPLPLVAVGEYVNEFTNLVAKDLEKKDQTPKLTIKPGKQAIPYDSKAELAATFKFPTPPPTARREEVVAMFKELSLPPIKAIRKEVANQRFADSFPFTEEALKDYANSGPTFEDIQKSPEKYGKEYPLRVATVEAILEMRKLKAENAKDELPEQYRSPIADTEKTKITNVYQRVISTRQATLEEQKEKLEAVLKNRDAEKSKRWLANFDYAYSQLRIRLAYISEYNLALGKVKLEQLPELDPKLFQKGWKLAASEKMISPKEIKDLATEGKADLTKIATENPSTPWAVLAKTQQNLAVGLRWQPSSFGADE